MRRHHVVALALALALPACTSGEQEVEQVSFSPAPGTRVGLDLLEQLDAPVRIGVVVTASGARGEGGEHAAPASGARVAQVRLGGATRVELQVQDDRGTADGAREAVQALLDDEVVGIVYASEGPHLDAAVQQAAEAGTAVLLPYDTRTQVGSAQRVWHTGPTGEQVAREFRALLGERGTTRPFVLAADTTPAPVRELAPSALRGRLGIGDVLLRETRRAADAVAAGRADALVVAGGSARQAEAVAALQEYDATAPVVLGPNALAPVFSQRLAGLSAEGAATTAGQYLTAGLDAMDTSTARPVSDFLAGVRQAAQDVSVLSLLGELSFAERGGAYADARSHDAVVALAAAVADAGSATPSDVREALAGLQVTADAGLAGPPLDFRSPAAVADDDVVVLQASLQDAALRGPVQEVPAALAWFAVPDPT